MIKEISTWLIDPIDNNCGITLTDAQITALSIWLTLAYNDPHVKPLWFARCGEFATRDGHTIKLKGMDGCMSMDTVIKFLKSINSICGGPLHHEYNRDGLYSVKVIDEILGYYDSRDRSCSSIGLRYTDDMKVWYGVKAKVSQGAELTSVNYKFDNLTLGQF
ncbi:hypothetical protein OBP_201 [Pseudomonas phage OBP]|uniref:hypothetical protein n=1 Tax=Pseudomonas phage OBP TaxID=1124849 RepID=UPI000240D5A9|nr:hypothetical protein OBP_201 [Pseudomonas phage OBP]AEV89638.1 hypothetical protein OBP_201 [Pseudomonas phage OBP]